MFLFDIFKTPYGRDVMRPICKRQIMSWLELDLNIINDNVPITLLWESIYLLFCVQV